MLKATIIKGVRRTPYIHLLLITLSIATMLTGIVAAQTEEMAIPTFTGIASDDGIEFVSEMSAGLVNFTFENNRSDAPYAPLIARLNDGVTLEEALGAGDEGIFLTTLYGGPQIASGESLTYTTDLRAGEYVLAEFAEGAEPDVLSFTVTEGAMADLAEPEADITLVMVDFAFGVPAYIAAGPQVWNLRNVGDQWHETAIFKVDDGMTTKDVRDAIAAGLEEPEQAFFWAPMGAGTQSWVTVDLEPGTYAVLCFLPDINGDFSPHFEHGMLQVFTVE